jgi:HD-GYP domain-containing protein (c-di-GMP phosphodiesterase class II)
MLLAEQLVGEARERRTRRMTHRERLVSGASMVVFIAVAVAIAILLPNERSVDPLVLAGLVAAYAVISRVRFEFGNTYVTPEQLAFIPLLVLAPLPLVPALVVVAALLAQVPNFVNHEWHWDRWTGAFADSWFCIGPVLVVAALAPGEPTVTDVVVYVLAFSAQILGDLSWATLRDRLLESMPTSGQLPFREIWRNYAGVASFDAMLTPLAFMISVAASGHELGLLAIAPLVLMLDRFSRERRERYGKTLELQRAYRGTVMLLSDVVEFDDEYTAEHSRSVVDLVHAVADELKVNPGDRQELEFAAMLHDVGKIAIPKQILHKPASLTSEEFEVMKTHTIEGQFMLDRVGGLLGRVGEIVRACHERWDGRGYPDGIQGQDIPLAARIVFGCDAYNAMTSDRVYRRAMSREAALTELRTNAGTQFDPRIVSALINVIEQSEPEISASPADEIRAVLADRPVASESRIRAAL